MFEPGRRDGDHVLAETGAGAHVLCHRQRVHANLPAYFPVQDCLHIGQVAQMLLMHRMTFSMCRIS